MSPEDTPPPEPDPTPPPPTPDPLDISPFAPPNFDDIEAGLPPDEDVLL